MSHWKTTYDPDDGEPIGNICHCALAHDHDGSGNFNNPDDQPEPAGPDWEA